MKIRHSLREERKKKETDTDRGDYQAAQDAESLGVSISIIFAGFLSRLSQVNLKMLGRRVVGEMIRFCDPWMASPRILHRLLLININYLYEFS
ncbi:MAG: hypothetical protein C5B47_01945 [Verrucomicrobia bacterium]|nr:MAG: hypothetical protein C5B47_01945 [Verrucomicrobiota bacterium]